jgi:hypothetical protein
MRVLVVSDLHANWPALEALLDRESYDALIVCGDLVSYGPHPREIVDFVRSHATLAVRGNHDHALATGTDCRCSPASRPLALPTLACHATMLGADLLRYLRGLLYTGAVRLEGLTCYAVHASPRDRLYERTVKGLRELPLQRAIVDQLAAILHDARRNRARALGRRNLALTSFGAHVLMTPNQWPLKGFSRSPRVFSSKEGRKWPKK